MIDPRALDRSRNDREFERFRKIEMTREEHHGITDQSRASVHRRDDAQVLLNAARWRGAMYLGGCSIECLVKSRLMRHYGCNTLHQLDEELKARGLVSSQATAYTHQFELLSQASGHLERLRGDRTLWASFNIVNRWIPAWRYAPDLSKREDAQVFFDALDQVSSWLHSNI